jgi:ketosteroid isomerase-like protein
MTSFTLSFAKRLGRLIAASQLVTACSTPATLSPSESKAVEATLAAYRLAWLDNDRQDVMDAVSDDIVLFVPGANSANVEGKDAVAAFWFPPSDTQFVIKSYDIADQEVHGAGHLAVVQGKSVLSWDTVIRDSTIASTTSTSEFLSVLRKENGRWRIFRQMYVLRK